MSKVILEPYAAKLYYHFDSALTGGELEKIFKRTFETLARRCVESGASLIGHIKGFTAPSGSHFMKVSVTSPSRPAQVEGHLPDGCRDLILTVNVHVYGLSRDVVIRLVERMADDPGLARIGRVRIEK